MTAVRDWNLPRATKLVAYTLASYANADGSEARPSQSTLGRGVDMEPRAVRNHLRALREAGVIWRVSRGSATGVKHTADVYQLTVSDDHAAIVRPVENT